MKKCPTCNRQVEWDNNPFRPFCSERCKLVDLGKWVTEEYHVAGKPVSSADKEDEDAENSSDQDFGTG